MTDSPIIAKILRLDLGRYRNYQRLSIQPQDDKNIIIITGANGSGKTNILEAISLLAPGRGIRGCKLAEIHSNADPTALYWELNSEVAGFYGSASIKTRVERTLGEESRSKRQIKINDNPAKSQAELSEILAVSWLTPQMDHLFISGASARRRFLDRIVQNFEPSHAKHLMVYEHAMRERLKLLKSKNLDPQWLDVLETNMVQAAAPVSASRQRAVDYIGQMMDETNWTFPRARIAVLCDYNPDQFAELLRKNRHLDTASGRTNAGVHRADLQVIYADKNLEADKCSTGEQKSLLISIFLAEIFAQVKYRGQTPILLLDEALAHLDENRRELLCQIIKDIKAQTWITGTEREIFAPLAGCSQFFRVDGGLVEILSKQV